VSPAAALIETIVHLEVPEELLPDGYQLLKIVVPDSVSREHVNAKRLPGDWIEDAVATRTVGDRWLRANGSALLEVPSAIVPETSNWLLNPDNADQRKIRVEWRKQYPYDGRLFQKRTR
jgi:RES domain-containing protein